MGSHLQLDRTWYLAVVNKASDEAAKTLGSHFTPAQIAFLKSVVRQRLHTMPVKWPLQLMM